MLTFSLNHVDAGDVPQFVLPNATVSSNAAGASTCASTSTNKRPNAATATATGDSDGGGTAMALPVQPDGGSDYVITTDAHQRVHVYSTAEQRIVASYKCETPPLCAIVCTTLELPSSEVHVAILLNPRLLRVIKLRGDSMDVQLYAPCDGLLSCPHGLLLYGIDHVIGNDDRPSLSLGLEGHQDRESSHAMSMFLLRSALMAPIPVDLSNVLESQSHVADRSSDAKSHPDSKQQSTSTNQIRPAHRIHSVVGYDQSTSILCCLEYLDSHAYDKPYVLRESVAPNLTLALWAFECPTTSTHSAGPGRTVSGGNHSARISPAHNASPKMSPHSIHGVNNARSRTSSNSNSMLGSHIRRAGSPAVHVTAGKASPLTVISGGSGNGNSNKSADLASSAPYLQRFSRRHGTSSPLLASAPVTQVASHGSMGQPFGRQSPSAGMRVAEDILGVGISRAAASGFSRQPIGGVDAATGTDLLNDLNRAPSPRNTHMFLNRSTTSDGHTAMNDVDIQDDIDIDVDLDVAVALAGSPEGLGKGESELEDSQISELSRSGFDHNGSLFDPFGSGINIGAHRDAALPFSGGGGLVHQVIDKRGSSGGRTKPTEELRRLLGIAEEREQQNHYRSQGDGGQERLGLTVRVLCRLPLPSWFIDEAQTETRTKHSHAHTGNLAVQVRVQFAGSLEQPGGLVLHVLNRALGRYQRISCVRDESPSRVVMTPLPGWHTAAAGDASQMDAPFVKSVVLARASLGITGGLNGLPVALVSYCNKSESDGDSYSPSPKVKVVALFGSYGTLALPPEALGDIAEQWSHELRHSAFTLSTLSDSHDETLTVAMSPSSNAPYIVLASSGKYLLRVAGVVSVDIAVSPNDEPLITALLLSIRLTLLQNVTARAISMAVTLADRITVLALWTLHMTSSLRATVDVLLAASTSFSIDCPAVGPSQEIKKNWRRMFDQLNEALLIAKLGPAVLQAVQMVLQDLQTRQLDMRSADLLLAALNARPSLTLTSFTLPADESHIATALLRPLTHEFRASEEHKNAKPTLDLSSLRCTPTLALVDRFLYYLSCQQATILENANRNSKSDSGDDGHAIARRVLEAFLDTFHWASSTDIPVTHCMHMLPSGLQVLVDLSLLVALPRVLSDDAQSDPANQRLLQRCPSYLLESLGRQDILFNAINRGVGNSLFGLDLLEESGVAAATSDGLAVVESSSVARFKDDERIREVCRMLRASLPHYLKVDRAPESSDLDHRQRQQAKLMALCKRSLAGSIGRGMLTISTLRPLIAEVLPLPPLSLSGRVPPGNSIVALDTSASMPDFMVWPDFHNGVAAVLRIGLMPTARFNSTNDILSDESSEFSRVSPSGTQQRTFLTRNWIVYNRTAALASGAEATHAGVLLGLGLGGHLKVLSVTDICDYLTQGHDATTVAVLIGTAASRLGSADPLLSKTLCLHLPALLPPRHTDLDISPAVQAAALTGLGLLHCGTGNRLMTEFLLAELAGRPPSNRTEVREAMALSTAWALGVVLLGCGSRFGPRPPSNQAADPKRHDGELEHNLNDHGLSDLCIEDRLQVLIDGGVRPPDSLLFPSHYLAADINSKPSRVLEGNHVNTNVTAPGAILALALMYIKSNNSAIASRLALPKALGEIEATRPDLLFYRAVAHCLVMWSSIEPTEEWLVSQIPSVILLSMQHHAVSNDSSAHQSTSKARSHRFLSSAGATAAYLNIASGLCLGLALVHAGTCNIAAQRLIFTHCKMLQSLRDNAKTSNQPRYQWSHSLLPKLEHLPVRPDRTLRLLVELCTCESSLALSCVMAGTGDITCLRLIREFRWRIEDIPYGSHMALSMALGLLFLSGGNASLRRDPLSIACLLLAFLPRFPERNVDNQYHLQPLRHLYALAVEFRAFRAIAIDTGDSVPVDIEITLLDGSALVTRSPCLLPELSTVDSVRTMGDDYHTVTVRRRRITGGESVRYRALEPSDLTVYLKRRVAVEGSFVITPDAVGTKVGTALDSAKKLHLEAQADDSSEMRAVLDYLMHAVLLQP